MKKTMISLFMSVLAAVSLMVYSGCSSLTDALRDGAEEALTERAEDIAYSALAPKEQLPPPESPNWGTYMANQAQVVFSYSFAAGGMWLGESDYKPGEYTKFSWNAEGSDKVILERAFLKRQDDGKEWWRVSWEEGEDSWIYEALFSTGDQKELLRLRARDAEGNEGEVPVTKGQAIYIPPAELTEESVAGATVGKEKLETPAGTFDTDHVIYMAVSGEGQVEWWLTSRVPGGVAKYLISEKSEGVIWTSTLIETGQNATTVLSSY